MILNHQKSLILQKIIKNVYSNETKKDFILSISPLINEILDSHYVAAFFLPNRFVKETYFISNNPREFYDAYLPVISFDYLLNTLVETNRPVYLEEVKKQEFIGKRDFEGAVQKIRPVSDVTYNPIQVNNSLCGYIAIGRAGLNNRIYSKNDNEIFSFISQLLNEGFLRSLYVEPKKDDIAILSGMGQVLMAGDRIDFALKELLGEQNMHCPCKGSNQNCKIFSHFIYDFLNPLSLKKKNSLYLSAGDKRFHFSLKYLPEPSFRSYFLNQPQLSITLHEENDLPVMQDIHDFSELSELYEFTPREIDIIRLICRGYSNKSISSDLKITEATVKYHIWNIFNKAGVDSRTQLMYSLSP